MSTQYLTNSQPTNDGRTVTKPKQISSNGRSDPALKIRKAKKKSWKNDFDLCESSHIFYLVSRIGNSL